MLSTHRQQTAYQYDISGACCIVVADPPVTSAESWLETMLRGEPTMLQQEDGTAVVLYPNNSVELKKVDGSKLVWEPKPTLTDIVNNTGNKKGVCYNVYKDGSIEQIHSDGSCYVWK